jgi:hypothetical protein
VHSVTPEARRLTLGNRTAIADINERCQNIECEELWGAREPKRRDLLGRFSFRGKSAASFRSTGSSEAHASGSAKRNFWALGCAVLPAILVVAGMASSSRAQNVTFKIPPVKIPLTIKDQAITITASALISMVSKDREVNIFNLQLSADLSELQQHMTELLSSQLDKNDRCGDRITIQDATLVPAAPVSLATVHLHYERWACVKAFGKQQAKRLVGGNAMIPLKLTPGVDENKTQLRLVPEVGTIEADGSLGELLRSGTVGEMIKEKIRTSILSAMQKGTNLSATLPPAVQRYATIENAAFKDAGSGRLMVVLEGQVRITKEQVQQLSQQVKEGMGKH